MTKLNKEIVRTLRHLVWVEGYGYREAALAVGAEDLAWTSIWAAIRGLSWKTAGGPTGGAEGRHPNKSKKKVKT